MFIQNHEIDCNVVMYRKVYREEGALEFELQDEEYAALGRLIKDYRNASAEENFDGEVWARKAASEGLFADGNAFAVFSFLITVWRSSTQLTADRRGSYMVVTVTNREMLQ